MPDLLDSLREVLVAVDASGAIPLELKASDIGPERQLGVALRTCGGFSLMLRQLELKTWSADWDSSSYHRLVAEPKGGVHISHACFPDSPCWTDEVPGHLRPPAKA